jgi:hypothetical protein
MASAAMGQGDGTGGALSVPEQIGAPKDDHTLQIQIAPAPSAAEEKTRVDQTRGGRDLCDPSVSDAERARAGVECDGELSVNGETAPPGLAEDPLLKPRDDAVEGDFKGLDLGDDVPPTVILQQ